MLQLCNVLMFPAISRAGIPDCGQIKLTCISQELQNQRAIYLARKNGIETIGVNADDVPAGWTVCVNM